MEGKKVYVGMSGGVDSSVSAALLKREGFDVTGVFIKTWQPEWLEAQGGCTWREDRLDAMRAAARLGIPFITLDLEKEYKREVAERMIAEYRAGKTPNPDIMCNTHVKFGGFFAWAMDQGADYVATGHYARIERDEGGERLLMGADQGKDQSYFLYTLSKEELSKTLFPVGGMRKPAVRKRARSFGLPMAEKKDSQGICFIGQVDMKEFLSHYMPLAKGAVLDESGKIIGEHDGAVFLTLGERHGFAVTDKKPDDAPYYVTGRDIGRNTVTVSQRRLDGSLSVEKKAFEIGNASWIGEPPETGKPYRARVRHLGELLPCSVALGNGATCRIQFDMPLIVAAGQSIVVYDGERCLGGGIAF